MNKRWVVNIGPESEMWDCTIKLPTEQEAIEYARQKAAEGGHTEYQVGKLVPASPCAPDAEHLLDDAYEQIRDLVGANITEDWYPTKDQKADLQQRLEATWSQWLWEHDLHEACYQITCVSDYGQLTFDWTDACPEEVKQPEKKEVGCKQISTTITCHHCSGTATINAHTHTGKRL